MNNLSLLVYIDSDFYIGQSLEVDVCVQAKTLEQLKYRFQAAVTHELLLRKSEGFDPALFPAPKEFFIRWKKSAPVNLFFPKTFSWSQFGKSLNLYNVRMNLPKIETRIQ